jgi:spore maturation protein A
MGRIWTVLLLLSVVFAMISGCVGETAAALLDSGEKAVTLMVTLLAAMTLWSGLMEILSASGDVQRMGRIFRRMLRPLFPGLMDDAAWNAITLNLSANLLGLGNAATPAGIEAAKQLASLGETGLRALAMLLALDNASLQLIPTTVITLRQAAGARDPADIWGMTLLISGASAMMAAALMTMISAGGNRHERLERRSHRNGGGNRGAQGCVDEM